jgi:hypothetical protein
MEKLQFVLFQLDESKRHILAGSVPALRVALLLLDNAVEVLLDRWIADDLDSDEMSEVIQRRARKAGIPEDHPHFVDLYQQRFLTASEKKRVARLFDEKLRYVTGLKGLLTPSMSAVLSHLHRYRNDAHHSGRVRTQTLRTSVVILLSLCCTLVELLKPGSSGYASTEDYSWLKEKFGLTPGALWDKTTTSSVLASLREGIPIDDATIGETFAQNIEDRIEALEEGLGFISTETHVAPSASEALAASQKFSLDEQKRAQPYRSGPPSLDAPVSIQLIEQIRSVPRQVREATDALAAFQTFATADTGLERLEFMVNNLVVAIDGEIQMAVDRARGK